MALTRGDAPWCDVRMDDTQDLLADETIVEAIFATEGISNTQAFLRQIPHDAHHGALVLNHGNASATARYLGVARPTVMAHLKRDPVMRATYDRLNEGEATRNGRLHVEQTGVE